MPRPEECRFTDQHEWVHIENGMARVGISDYAAEELGSIVFVNMGEPGRTLAARDELGEVESVKTVASVYAPVGGEVVAINKTLEGSPEAVNNDPYGEGWLVLIRPEDPGQADGLMDYAAYRKFLETAAH